MARRSELSGRGPLRVTHVITGLNTGGAEMVLARLVTATDPARVRHRIVALLAGGAVHERLVTAGIPVDTLSMAGVPHPGHVWRLIRLMRRHRPHVIQGWLVHGNVAATVARAGWRRAALAWNVRQALYDIRDEPRGTRVTLRASARLARLAERIVYNSETAAEHHERLGYPRSRRVVVPNGFDVDLFRPDPVARAEIRAEAGVAADAPLVGTVARFHPHKDHETLLAAAARLRDTLPDVCILLAGSGISADNPALTDIIRRYGLEDRVRLLGERRDTHRIYAALDVLAMPSFTEAFPNVVGEAMASGTPCVSTDVGATRAIIGDAGVVVPPRDPVALSAGLRELLALPQPKRLALGRKARQRIVREWPCTRTVEQYLELYELLAHERGAEATVDPSQRSSYDLAT